MRQCPLFTPREDLKKRPPWEGKIRANCGNCRCWDWDARIAESELEAWREWREEWQVDTFEVTAYTLECGYPWDDGFTFLGTRAASGQTVAVDPEVISLGSEIFIHGLGWRKAEDIGTAVKGYTVDLYMGAGPEAKALAMRWGRKTVKVVYMKNGHSD